MSHVSTGFDAPVTRDRTVLAAVGVPLVLVAGILAVSPNFRLVSGPEAEPFGGDVLHEWTGAWVLTHGERSRLYDLDYVRSVQHDPAVVGFEWDRNAYLPMVYPPFWYLVLSPLGSLPLPVAAVVWTLLTTTCLVGAAFVLLRWQGEQPGTLRAEWALLAAAAFAPVILSLSSGQKGTLLLLLFGSTFVLLDRKRPFLAGLVFGLVAFKPQLTLVVGFTMLFKRQWRFLAGGVTTGAVLVGLSFLAGADLCGDYFALVAGMGNYVQTGGYDLAEAHCWWGSTQLLLGGWPDGVVKGVVVALTLWTLALVVRVARRPFAYGSPTFALQFASLVVATLVTSPHLYTYDLTLLLLPLFLVASVALDPRHSLGRTLPAVGVLLYVAVGLSPRLAAATGLQLSVLLMLALLDLLGREATGCSELSESPADQGSGTSVRQVARSVR